MNTEYTKEFFQKAYQEFKELEKIIHFGSRPEESKGKESQNSYFKNVYPLLNEFIETETKSILVISPYASEYFIRESINKNDTQVTHLIYEKDLSLPAGEFDLIFLDHCSSLLNDKLFSKLKIKLKEPGKIMTLDFNHLHIANIINLLLNEKEVLLNKSNFLCKSKTMPGFKLLKSLDYKFHSQKFLNKSIALISFLNSISTELPLLKETSVYSRYNLYGSDII